MTPWQDVLAIRDVVDRYCVGIDRRDWDLVRSCFTPDCNADYGRSGRWQEREPFVAWLDEIHRDVGPTMHRLTNHQVHVDGDVATATLLSRRAAPRRAPGLRPPPCRRELRRRARAHRRRVEDRFPARRRLPLAAGVDDELTAAVSVGCRWAVLAQVERGALRILDRAHAGVVGVEQWRDHPCAQLDRPGECGVGVGNRERDAPVRRGGGRVERGVQDGDGIGEAIRRTGQPPDARGSRGRAPPGSRRTPSPATSPLPVRFPSRANPTATRTPRRRTPTPRLVSRTFSSLKFHEPGAFTSSAPRLSRACHNPNTAPDGSAQTATRPADGMSTGAAITRPPCASTSRGRLVGRVDPDIGGPAGRDRRRPPARRRLRRRQSVESRVRVAGHDVLGCAHLEGPSEQSAVEGHRGVEIGLDDVDPARDARRVAAAWEHSLLLLNELAALKVTNANRTPAGRITPARRRIRRARSTTRTAGSGGSPPASPPTPPGARAQSCRGSSRCSPSPRRRGR